MTNKLISLVIITFILLTSHSYSDSEFLFPKKKPSIFKKIEKKIGQNYSKNLPQKKPIIQPDKPQEKITLKEETLDKKKEAKENIITKKKLKIVKQKSDFILPRKKPSVYKASTKEKEKSTILSKKDFEELSLNL